MARLHATSELAKSTALTIFKEFKVNKQYVSEKLKPETLCVTSQLLTAEQTF